MYSRVFPVRELLVFLPPLPFIGHQKKGLEERGIERSNVERKKCESMSARMKLWKEREREER